MTASQPAQPGDRSPVAGNRIRRASWWGTAAFAATAVVASVFTAAEAVAFAVAVALFLAGLGLFGAAYLRAVGRSRTDEISVAGLFFLAGSAPVEVRRSLLGSLAAEVVVAVATAVARPYTSLVAGTLVPLYGLGLCGLWGARHGTFPPRRRLKRRR